MNYYVGDGCISKRYSYESLFRNEGNGCGIVGVFEVYWWCSCCSIYEGDFVFVIF